MRDILDFRFVPMQYTSHTTLGALFTQHEKIKKIIMYEKQIMRLLPAYTREFKKNTTIRGIPVEVEEDD